jgi:hypothetical protein
MYSLYKETRTERVDGSYYYSPELRFFNATLSPWNLVELETRTQERERGFAAVLYSWLLLFLERFSKARTRSGSQGNAQGSREATGGRRFPLFLLKGRFYKSFVYQKRSKSKQERTEIENTEKESLPSSNFKSQQFSSGTVTGYTHNSFFFPYTMYAPVDLCCNERSKPMNHLTRRSTPINS